MAEGSDACSGASGISAGVDGSALISPRLPRRSSEGCRVPAMVLTDRLRVCVRARSSAEDETTLCGLRLRVRRLRPFNDAASASSCSTDGAAPRVRVEREVRAGGCARCWTGLSGSISGAAGGLGTFIGGGRRSLFQTGLRSALGGVASALMISDMRRGCACGGLAAVGGALGYCGYEGGLDA